RAVGRAEQRRRHGEAERFGALEIDQQLEFGRLLDRKVAGLRALENLVDVLGSPALYGVQARTIRNKAAGFHELPRLIDCRQAPLRSELNYPFAMLACALIHEDQQGVCSPALAGCGMAIEY